MPQTVKKVLRKLATAARPAPRLAALNPPTGQPEEPPALALSAHNLLEDAWRYQVDLWQRNVLFLEILRERANNMLAHEQAGLQ